MPSACAVRVRSDHATDGEESESPLRDDRPCGRVAALAAAVGKPRGRADAAAGRRTGETRSGCEKMVRRGAGGGRAGGRPLRRAGEVDLPPGDGDCAEPCDNSDREPAGIVRARTYRRCRAGAEVLARACCLNVAPLAKLRGDVASIAGELVASPPPRGTVPTAPAPSRPALSRACCNQPAGPNNDALSSPRLGREVGDGSVGGDGGRGAGGMRRATWRDDAAMLAGGARPTAGPAELEASWGTALGVAAARRRASRRRSMRAR